MYENHQKLTMKDLHNILSFGLCASFALCPSQASAQMQRESFETWDGETKDWLPEGWTEFHGDPIIPTLKDGEYTWHVITPTTSRSLPKATEGNYYAAIGYAKDADGKDIYQDEWLMSPAYKLSEYGGTLEFDVAYSPLFLFLLDNDHVDWANNDFFIRESSADLQLWVRTLNDNGEWNEEWEGLWSNFYDWSMQSLATLMALSGTTFRTNWRTFFLTDDEFKGKTVQLAFRYVGQQGNIMGIDNIRINYAERVEVDTKPDAIGQLPASAPSAATYFNLAGQRSNTAFGGFNVVKRPDGTTRKIIK